ncbi:MAG: hypothetical protein RIR26_288 [Pseudomonadota bacterium]|jgi:hypothetical protein
MELTNLVWHLGALVAAVWAAFAYRSLVFSRGELEQGVVGSLLPPTESGRPSALPIASSAAFLARRRSVRSRALRWFASELQRRRRITVQWNATIFALSDEEWRLALMELYAHLNAPVPSDASPSQTCSLTWSGEAGKTVQWSVKSTAGEVS